MDLFARTFPLAAADAGFSALEITRHLALHHRRPERTDPVLLVSRCLSADRPWAGEHLLALTGSRLSVSHASRALHRIRLRLDAPVSQLRDVHWSVDPRRGTADLAVTTAGGERERFQLTTGDPELIDTTFGFVFRSAAEVRPVPARRPVPTPNIGPVPR
jgi:hypothetical protein